MSNKEVERDDKGSNKDKQQTRRIYKQTYKVKRLLSERNKASGRRVILLQSC